MTLSEVMTKDVEVISPDASLQEAAGKMRQLDVGMMPVCNGERLVGALTDRDIAIRAVAEGKDPRATKVSEVMSDGVVYCYSDQDVGEAAQVMKDKQIRRLLILDRQKQLCGVVSLGDIAVDVGDDHLSGDVLSSVSKPGR